MSNRNHFIFINQSCSEFFFDTAKSLAIRGHEVTIIAGNSLNIDFPSIRFLHGPEYNRKNTFFRLKTWFEFLLFVLKSLFFEPRGSIIITCSNPPLLPHLCVLFFSKKFLHVSRILDIYPDVLKTKKAFNRIPFLYAMWRSINKIVYKRCKAVITLGNVMSKTLRKSYDGIPFIVPDWHTLKTELLPDRLQNPMRNQLGLGSRLVVLYSGNMGLAHDLSVVVSAASSFRNDDRIRFVFIGDGPQKTKLINQVKKLNLSNSFHFLPYQPNSNLVNSLKLGDLSIVTIAEGANASLMPCKCYNYMAAGSCIIGITNKPSDLADVVESHSCGVIVQPYAVESLISKINYFLDNPKILKSYQEAAANAANECYSFDVNCHKLVNLLEFYSNNSN